MPSSAWEVASATAAGTHPDLHGRCAFEQVHGWTPDISLYVMHGWYEVVAFLDNDNERKLACWLGPAEDYGGGDAVFLLPKSARPIVRSTVWALTPNERADCTGSELTSLVSVSRSLSRRHSRLTGKMVIIHGGRPFVRR